MIEYAIGPQSFEIIRDRVGVIIADELDMQFQLTYDKLFESRIYMERFIPFNESEYDAVNITVARVNLDSNTMLQSDGANTIFIDVYTKGRSYKEVDKLIDGSAIATRKMHRLVGVIRAILMDSRYKTLGFEPGFILRRQIVDLRFANPKVEDNVCTATGRIVFEVRAVEINGSVQPRILADFETVVKLHESEEGYYYFGEN